MLALRQSHTLTHKRAPPHLVASLERIMDTALENAFADTSCLSPSILEWFPDTEEIHMIEFEHRPHRKFLGVLSQSSWFAKPVIDRSTARSVQSCACNNFAG
ncbi:hypothetical protein H257_12023 [Aphanomyces astaci]|uniref:Uncharacterized protein n=1 Tax=Aphanomyces astaci TaxID=112090 RepID=W4G1S0_APHAT|nr:hypothetical protein H257_12023 [Aphanomyces astaci]ETV73221.1 hypothetical protein H257_12023 [Aphanomyces astaci]|eukprot:XP_009837426.1 hypothetical protein H257_12023 [Aphanomyces astaci]